MVPKIQKVSRMERIKLGPFPLLHFLCLFFTFRITFLLSYILKFYNTLIISLIELKVKTICEYPLHKYVKVFLETSTAL